MTPIPKPKPKRSTFIRARYNLQLTNGQSAMRERRLPPIKMPTDEEIAEALHNPPQPGDTIAALPCRHAIEDEMDAGFYNAVWQRWTVVGEGVGEVPEAVAERLYKAGLIRVVKE